MFCMRIRGADGTWGLINKKYVENIFLFSEFPMFRCSDVHLRGHFRSMNKASHYLKCYGKSISSRYSSIVHRINHPLACFTWFRFRSLMIGIAAHRRVNNNIFLTTSVRAHTSPSNMSFDVSWTFSVIRLSLWFIYAQFVHDFIPACGNTIFRYAPRHARRKWIEKFDRQVGKLNKICS